MQARKKFDVFSLFSSLWYSTHHGFSQCSLMLLMLAIAIGIPSSTFGAGTVLLGNQNIASGSDSTRPGEAEAFQFTAASSGTLTSLTVYLDSSSSSTQLIAGIYSSSGQNPGTLLAQGSLSRPASNAWNTVTVPPVNITAGTVYWVAILGTGGTLKFRDSGSNCVSQSSSQVNLTSLASTWSLGSRWYTCTLSAYGSSSATTPILSLSQSSLAFSATQGSGTDPAAATVNITNTGGGALSFTASSDSAWLTVSPAAGNAPQPLQISATLGSLTAGTYTGHVSVTASGAQNSPANITVTFSVAAPTPSPSLSVSPKTLSFSQTQGAVSNLTAVAITVSNTGGGSLSFTASSDSTWLSVSPSSGTAPQSLQVNANMGSLLPGTYTGNITITAAGVAGSPAIIPVTFTIAADVAPVISAVTASSITASAAVITWTTDKPASSQVNFGTTTAYGSSSPVNNSLVTSHFVSLSGLLPSAVYHYQVQSADSAGSLGGSPDATFTTAAAAASSCPCSIFSSTAIPGTITVNDNQAVELGVKFTSDVSGFVTGIRFYKSSSNTGTHTGTLWTSSGTALAVATFSGESSSGWQTVTFSSPVAIAANTTYIASYHTNTGFYSADPQYFANSAVNRSPLHAPASGSSGNGVYVYGSGGSFPRSSWQASNYWVDVVFNTTQAPPPTTFSISGTATGGNGATITLSGAASASTTADSSGNFSLGGLANGSYTVTPVKSGASFTPTSRTVTINNANVTGVSFATAAVTYSISGNVASGGGSTLTLSGSSSATVTADASGNFTFSGLINGNYVVTPTKSGSTFSPSTQAVTINGANATNVNFTASVAATTYTISGTISPASVGSGVAVSLSGSASATTTANSGGNFTFTSVSNGNYTITPSSSIATFSPTSQSVSVNNANASGVTFAGTATSNVIFFDDFTAPTLNPDWVAMNRAGDYSNNEQECYNPSQVSLDGNNLVLTTIAQATTCGDSVHSPSSFPFLSGYVQWKTFNFTYGTVEFRAKTAGGRGSWPAIWMLGSDCQASNISSADNVGACNWPNSGSDEIDIVEMSDNNYISVGHDMFVSSGGQACFQNASSDTSQNWHVYTMTWKPGSVTYAIDGTRAGCSHTQNVPTQPMFLIINNAIASSGAGGNWPVVPSDFPQTMQVDYVKVTQP